MGVFGCGFKGTDELMVPKTLSQLRLIVLLPPSASIPCDLVEIDHGATGFSNVSVNAATYGLPGCSSCSIPGSR